ncbi:MAG: hypothetical protein AB7K09_21225 [Planctomycetota bacterium]
MNIDDYHRLRRQLDVPRPTVIADWPEFVHPHDTGDDDDFPAPTADSVQGRESEWYANDPRLSPWHEQVFSRLPGITRQLMASWAAVMVLDRFEAVLRQVGYGADVVSQPRRCLVLAWEPFDQGERPGIDPAQTAAMYRNRPELVHAATRMQITSSGDRIAQRDEAELFDALPDMVAFVRGIPPVAAARAWARWVRGGSEDSFLARWWRIARSRFAVANVEHAVLLAAQPPELPDQGSPHSEEHARPGANPRVRDPEGAVVLACSGRAVGRERLLG